jgi:hypothetical protein
MTPEQRLELIRAWAAEPDRYRLEKTESGYVRMDTRTGEMSICEERCMAFEVRPILCPTGVRPT